MYAKLDKIPTIETTSKIESHKEVCPVFIGIVRFDK